MNRFIALITVFIFVSHIGSAQEYNSSAGIRLGTYFMGSYKSFITENHAIEAVAGIYRQGGQSSINVGAIYAIHHSITDQTPTLSFYYGGSTLANLPNENIKLGLHIGGVLGLEYKIPNARFVLFNDINPQWDILHGLELNFQASIGVRYILSTQEL